MHSFMITESLILHHKPFFSNPGLSAQHGMPCRFLVLSTCKIISHHSLFLRLLLLFMLYLSQTRNLLEISVKTRSAESFVECLACDSRHDQTTRGLWERDCANFHVSGKRICLRPAYSNEIRNGVFSTESKRWQKKMEKYLGKKQQWKELAKQRFFPAMQV